MITNPQQPMLPIDFTEALKPTVTIRRREDAAPTPEPAPVPNALQLTLFVAKVGGLIENQR